MTKRKPSACVRCGEPATEEFSICADGNVPRRVCPACDIAINAMVMDFMQLPDAAQKMVIYIGRKVGK